MKGDRPFAGGINMKVLKHVVMWRFLDEAEGRTKQENMRYCAERLRSLVGLAPTLMALKIGEDELHSPASYDMALICDFVNLEGMLAYRDFPPHKEISAYIGKVTSARVVSDFFVEQ